MFSFSHRTFFAFRLPRHWGLGGLFLLLTLAAPALAATTYYVSPGGRDTNPGTYTKPFKTIQYAIDAASNGDTVTLKDGTFTGPGDVDLDFGGRSITVEGQHGANQTIIDCAGSRSAFHRGFYLHSGEMSAMISGITMENGYEGSGDGYEGAGGAIDIEANTTVILTNIIFTDNTATGYGGAIHNFGNLTLTGCTFTNNVSNDLGGALYDNSNGITSIANCTFTNNSGSTTGGGIYNSDKSMTVKNCTFTGNYDGGYGGGGIRNYGSIKIEQCMFTSNINRGFANSGTATLTDCSFADNTGSYGGGIRNYPVSGAATVTLTHCTFTNNTGTYAGGGSL